MLKTIAPAGGGVIGRSLRIASLTGISCTTAVGRGSTAACTAVSGSTTGGAAGSAGGDAMSTGSGWASAGTAWASTGDVFIGTPESGDVAREQAFRPIDLFLHSNYWLRFGSFPLSLLLSVSLKLFVIEEETGNW